MSMIVDMMKTRMSLVRSTALLPLVVAGLLIPAGSAAAASATEPVVDAATVDTTTVDTTVVDYAASDEIIANPQRGFHDNTITHYREDGSDYEPLDLAELRTAREDGITQLVRVIYMEKFVDQPTLDPEWLALVQADFDTAREAGVSVIPRFAYVEGVSEDAPPYGDAPLDIVLGHIEQLGPTLAGNADVITTMQAGFIGAWGEGYYTDYFSDPADPSIVTDANWADRRAVVDALLDVLPADRTIQLRTMRMKQVIEGVPTGAAGALTEQQAYDGSDLARVGHHNDCFLASPDDFGTFLSDPITLDQEYLAAETRFVPMGGETCAVNPPRSEYPSAAADMARYHYSYLNRDYNQDVLNSWGEAGLEETAKRLGYRFVMEQSRATGSRIELDVRNDGWAAPYNARPSELVLTGDAGTFRLPFGPDARTWAPGTVSTVAADACSLPAGSYTASLALPSTSASVATNPDFAVQTANIGTWDAASGVNTLSQTLVSSGSCAEAVPEGTDPERLAATGSEAWLPLLALATASLLAGGLLIARPRR